MNTPEPRKQDLTVKGEPESVVQYRKMVKHYAVIDPTFKQPADVVAYMDALLAKIDRLTAALRDCMGEMADCGLEHSPNYRIARAALEETI